MLQQEKRWAGVLLLSLLMVGAMGLEVEIHAEGTCKVCYSDCISIFGYDVFCWEECAIVTPCLSLIHI